MTRINPAALGTTVVSDSPLNPLPAEEGAVKQFGALMAAPKAAQAAAKTALKPVTLATDEQLAKLQPADLQTLKDRWGDDEAGFRKEGYEFYQLQGAMLDTTMKQFVMDSYKKRKEREHDLKNI